MIYRPVQWPGRHGGEGTERPGKGCGEEEGRARQKPPPKLSKHGASALGLGGPSVAFNGETLQKKVLKKPRSLYWEPTLYLGLYHMLLLSRRRNKSTRAPSSDARLRVLC